MNNLVEEIENDKCKIEDVKICDDFKKVISYEELFWLYTKEHRMVRNMIANERDLLDFIEKLLIEESGYAEGEI